MSEDKIGTIEQVHTACVDCIFAEKANQTQTGCNFGRLEAYKEKGAEIIDAYDEHGNEFSVINGKMCLYKRTKEWGELVPKKKWKQSVVEQIKMRYHALISFNPDHTLEQLHQTMESLNSQENPPVLISIMSQSNLLPTQIIEYLNSKDYPNLEWRLQTFLDKELHERQTIDLAIDTTKKLVKIVFYIVFQAGFETPKEMSSEIQKYFVDDMQHAIFAFGREDGNGMLVSFPFHIQHAGNSFNIKIEDKLREFEEGAEAYFRKIEDICPSLKM
jgi:hypothetical protein